MIPGLTYTPNFITAEEQEQLLKQIDQMPWCLDLRRRTQHYGYKYDYTKKRIDESMRVGEIPDWIAALGSRLTELQLFNVNPDQVIVNEYQKGQGISKHVDSPTSFSGTISSLSLLSPCYMYFEHIKSGKIERMLLEPGSMLTLTGEARYEWMHAIDRVKTRRVSLTFRKVLLS